MSVSQRLADTRRWAFYEIGAQMCAADTGTMHGPAAYAGDKGLRRRFREHGRQRRDQGVRRSSWTEQVEKLARCEYRWLGIGEVEQVPVAGHEVVGLRGAGKRDQVVVVRIGR